MKAKDIIFSLLFLILLSALGRAQSVYGEYATRDGLRLLEIGKALAAMPETGAKPEDYVPPHWTITSRAEGDLNADGINDFAFTIMLDEQDEQYMQSLEKLYKDSSWIDRTFIIVVADSRGDKKIHLDSINYNIYGDTNAPARNGDERDEFSLAITKNVLDVKISYGGMMRSNPTFHFREQSPTDGGLILIGFDFFTYCAGPQPDCTPSKLSENYLTNTRIETENKLRDNDYVSTDKRAQIAPVKIEFMNVRLSDANQKGYTRPF